VPTPARLADAWRTLGIAAPPTVQQVKAAYRRRARELHPDAVGGGAVPAANAARFARVTEAYETALEEARRSGRRAASTGGPASPRSAPRAPRGPAPATGGRTTAPSGDRPAARPGSTTYDGAAPADEDPPWDGASWVGADSGTYWTVNPREYADPRKHGPEYRARGRRPVRRAPRPGGVPERRTDGVPLASDGDRAAEGGGGGLTRAVLLGALLVLLAVAIAIGARG